MKNNLANLISWSSFIINIIVIVLISNDVLNINFIFFSVIVSMFLDFLDGRVARKFLTKKEDFAFGEALDSLCDLINFGIVPMYTFLYFFKSNIIISIFIASFYIWASTFRLAKFSKLNSVQTQSSYNGLPTTVAGPLSILLTLIFSNMIALATISQLALGFFMISNIKISKFKGF